MEKRRNCSLFRKIYDVSLSHLQQVEESHYIFISEMWVFDLIFLQFSKPDMFLINCGDLTSHQPLWVILCRLPEKGRKEIVEIKERDREETGTGMKVKKKIKKEKHSPPNPNLLQG